MQQDYEKGKKKKKKKSIKSGVKIKNEQTKSPQGGIEKTGRRRGLERHGGAERALFKTE